MRVTVNLLLTLKQRMLGTSLIHSDLLFGARSHISAESLKKNVLAREHFIWVFLFPTKENFKRQTLRISSAASVVG